MWYWRCGRAQINRVPESCLTRVVSSSSSSTHRCPQTQVTHYVPVDNRCSARAVPFPTGPGTASRVSFLFASSRATNSMPICEFCSQKYFRYYLLPIMLSGLPSNVTHDFSSSFLGGGGGGGGKEETFSPCDTYARQILGVGCDEFSWCGKHGME